MRIRLTAYVLGTVAVLVWILTAVLRLETRPQGGIGPLSVSPELDRQLRGVRMNVFKEGRLGWDVWAEEAIADEAWDHVSLREVSLRSTLNDRESLESRAPEGRVDRPTNVFGLVGGVITVAQLDVAPEGTEQPRKPQIIEIVSDEMTAHDNADKATFTGHVVAKTEEYLIKSETLDANYDPKTHEVVGFTARGGVRVIDREDAATWAEGQEGVYSKRTGEMLLTGSPRIHQGDKVSTGDRVKIIVKEKKMMVLGSEQTPVRAFIPEKDVRE